MKLFIIITNEMFVQDCVLNLPILNREKCKQTIGTICRTSGKFNYFKHIICSTKQLSDFI